MFAAGAIGLGLLLGLAAGGSVSRLPQTESGVWISLTVLFLVQGIARGRVFGLDSAPLSIAIWSTTSIAVALAIAWRCRPSTRCGGECTGLRLVLMGTALNVLVVLLNQGMPAVFVSGVEAAIERSGGFYTAINAATIMPWMGDAMRMRLGPSSLLLSVGDVLLAVGVCVVLVALMLGQDERPVVNGARP